VQSNPRKLIIGTSIEKYFAFALEFDYQALPERSWKEQNKHDLMNTAIPFYIRKKDAILILHKSCIGMMRSSCLSKEKNNYLLIVREPKYRAKSR
jgi:hypothetical protein